jgi:hypothetical protein
VLQWNSPSLVIEEIMATMSHSEGNRFEHTPSTTLRLYGIVLRTDSQDTEGEAVAIVYCGFKANGNDMRVPTGRVFTLRKSQIAASGEVAEYVVGRDKVQYFDVPIAADVHETQFKRISLAAEVVPTTGGTFAGLVATQPTRAPLDLSDIERLSREQLLEKVRALRAGDPAAEDWFRGCAGYCQSYKTTWYGVGHREDPGGADCCPV